MPGMFRRITTIRSPTQDSKVVVIQNGFPGAGHLLLVAFLMISIPTLSRSGGISNSWGAQSCCGNLHLYYGGPGFSFGLRAFAPALAGRKTTFHTHIRRGYVSKPAKELCSESWKLPFSVVKFTLGWPGRSRILEA